MKLARIGMWVWGGVTVALAIAFLSIVVAAGLHIEFDPQGDKYSFVNAPRWLAGLFFALKENGSLVAGILGFSGVAWSHFFKQNNNIQ